MPGAFASMAAELTGTAPPALPTRAEALNAKLARGADAWRQTGDPALVAMADGLDRYRREGGDLAKLLGAKAGRGRRNEVPRNHLQRQALVDVLKFLVADDDGRIADPRKAGKAAAAYFARSPSLVGVIREVSGVDRVPTSEKTLVRIYRGAES